MDVTTTNHRQTAEEEVDVKYTVAGMVAIHSQVRKIKQEFEKTMHPAAIEQPKIRLKIKKRSNCSSYGRERPEYCCGGDLLLADQSILNERDKKGNTEVHIATRKCRSEIVSMLLSFTSISVNAINHQQETAMDIVDKLNYGPPKLEIMEALTEAGAKHAHHVGRIDEEMQLKRTVSDIKHHSQLLQNEQTQRRVSGIAKELKKIHREAVQNTINSLTVVAVLFASIAFLAIFNLPGQYFNSGKQAVRNLNTNQNHQLSIMKVEECKDDAEDSLMMGGDETGNANCTE
ncbi:hypothetical protein R6Q57_022072 [Mikania cordata]